MYSFRKFRSSVSLLFTIIFILEQYNTVYFIMFCCWLFCAVVDSRNVLLHVCGLLQPRPSGSAPSLNCIPLKWGSAVPYDPTSNPSVCELACATTNY